MAKHRTADLPWYLRTNREEIAELFGLTSGKSVHHWGCNEVRTSPYDLRVIVQWWASNVYLPKVQSGDGRRTGATTPSVAALKEKKLQQEIRREELRFATECRKLIPVQFVNEVFIGKLAPALQKAGDNLRKHHGDAAQKILLDTLKAMEAEVEGMWRELDAAEAFENEMTTKGEKQRKRVAKKKKTAKKTAKKKATKRRR